MRLKLSNCHPYNQSDFFKCRNIPAALMFMCMRGINSISVPPRERRPSSVALLQVPSLTLDGFFLTRYHSCADSITIDMAQLVREQNHTSCCFFLNMRINLKIHPFFSFVAFYFIVFIKNTMFSFQIKSNTSNVHFLILTSTKVVMFICPTRKTIQALNGF